MYYTGEALYRIVQNNINKIPHDIKGVIAVARGGLFPAFIISEHFNIPITTVDKFIENSRSCWFNESTTIKFENITNGKLLVIDDSIETGKSINATIQKLNNIYTNFSFVYCVIHSSRHENDIIVLNETPPETRLYEFNLFRTYMFSGVVTDLDGVMCKDSIWGLDTHEKEYIEFMNTVPPYLHIPSIDTILTSRLDIYREYTEKWLQKNNIKYNQLIMSPLPSIKEKLELMKAGKWSDADWKCKKYMEICQTQNRIPVMIESNEYDASYIKHNFSKGIIFCTDKNCFIE